MISRELTRCSVPTATSRRRETRMHQQSPPGIAVRPTRVQHPLRRERDQEQMRLTENRGGTRDWYRAPLRYEVWYGHFSAEPPTLRGPTNHQNLLHMRAPCHLFSIATFSLLRILAATYKALTLPPVPRRADCTNNAEFVTESPCARSYSVLHCRFAWRIQTSIFRFTTSPETFPVVVGIFSFKVTSVTDLYTDTVILPCTGTCY